MKQRRAAVLGVLFLALIMLATGCKTEKEKDPYGDIKEVTVTAENQTVTGGEMVNEFNATKTDLPYEWSELTVGRAMLKLPYPSTWKVYKDTDYKIAIKAPADDLVFPGLTIYFHSTLEGEAVKDSSQIIERFRKNLANDVYTYGDVRLSVPGNSEIDNIVVDKDIIDPNRQMQKTYRDYDCNARINGNNKTDSRMYREICSFYWHTFPCVLTGIVPEESADQLNDLLNYMYTNAKAVDERIADTAMISIFPNTTNMTIPMSPLFTQYYPSPGSKFTDAVGFACPMDSGTGYSQSTLLIFETKKENFHMTSKNFEDEYLDTILRAQFGVGTDRLVTYGHMESDDGFITFGGKNGAKTKEYIYQFIIDSGNIPKGCFRSQAWEIDMYPIEHNGYIDFACLIAPYDGQAWGFDLIKLMALKMHY